MCPLFGVPSCGIHIAIGGKPRPVTLQDEMGLAKWTIRPAVILHRGETILYRLLPEVRTATVALSDAFAASMSTCLTHIAAEMHADRRARDMRAVETSRKKMFRDKYGERIADGLLLLTGASDDYLLSPFYQELGGRQNGESERVILKREVDQSAEVLGVLPFKATPSQSIDLKTFDVCVLSVSKFGTDVLPFSITPPPPRMPPRQQQSEPP
jgi:hypothetical protein